jgi:hypothetical protein
MEDKSKTCIQQCVWRVIVKLNELLLEFGEHYDTLDKNETHMYDEYHGRNVIWLGETGKMVKATPENSEPIWGNIFDQDKIDQTADDIRYAEDKVKFYAPLAHPTIIDIQNVAENLQANAHDDLMYDPAIDDYHTYTTRDSELDAYLLDAEEFLGDNSIDDDIESLENEMEDRRKLAQEEEWGDIGDISIQIRDGNHRRTAAFAAGEPYIWVRVSDDVGPYFDEGIKPFME